MKCHCSKLSNGKPVRSLYKHLGFFPARIHGLALEDDDDYEDLEDAALIEESQTMDEAVINILDDPLALSMTLRNQYDQVQQKN